MSSGAILVLVRAYEVQINWSNDSNIGAFWALCQRMLDLVDIISIITLIITLQLFITLLLTTPLLLITLLIIAQVIQQIITLQATIHTLLIQHTLLIHQLTFTIHSNNIHHLCLPIV